VSKEGEIHYLRNLGEEGVRHAAAKPFSDAHCSEYLAEIGAILSLLPAPPARLLDLGCGTGWTSVFFAKRGHDVVGVDISPDMIRQANRLRDKEELANLRFLASDYEQMDFQEEFDCAVFFDSLHHAVDEALALRKTFQALRPGGLCVTSEPGEGHAAVSAEIAARYDVTEKDMPPAKIMALGRDAGFQHCHVFPHSWGNQLIDYRIHDIKKEQETLHETRTHLADPLARSSWLKRLFHYLFRRRFALSRPVYSTLIARLEWMQRQPNGLVVLIK